MDEAQFEKHLEFLEKINDQLLNLNVQQDKMSVSLRTIQSTLNRLLEKRPDKLQFAESRTIIPTLQNFIITLKETTQKITRDNLNKSFLIVTKDLKTTLKKMNEKIELMRESPFVFRLVEKIGVQNERVLSLLTSITKGIKSLGQTFRKQILGLKDTLVRISKRHWMFFFGMLIGALAKLYGLKGLVIPGLAYLGFRLRRIIWAIAKPLLRISRWIGQKFISQFLREWRILAPRLSSIVRRAFLGLQRLLPRSFTRFFSRISRLFIDFFSKIFGFIPRIFPRTGRLLARIARLSTRFGGPILAGITGVIEGIIDAFGTWRRTQGNILQRTLAAIGAFFTGKGKGIGNAIWNAIKLGSIGFAIGSVAGTPLIGGVIGGILGFLLGFFGYKSIGRFLGRIFSPLKRIPEAIKRAIEGIGRFFSGIKEKITSLIGKIPDPIRKIGKAVLLAALGPLGAIILIFQKIKWITRHFSEVKNKIASVIRKIPAPIKRIGQIVLLTALGPFGAVIQIFQKIRWVARHFSEIKDKVKGFISKVPSVVKKIGEILVRIGMIPFSTPLLIFKGVKWIVRHFLEIKDKAKGFISRIPSVIKKAGDILIKIGEIPFTIPLLILKGIRWAIGHLSNIKKFIERPLRKVKPIITKIVNFFKLIGSYVLSPFKLITFVLRTGMTTIRGAIRRLGSGVKSLRMIFPKLRLIIEKIKSILTVPIKWAGGLFRRIGSFFRQRVLDIAKLDKKETPEPTMKVTSQIGTSFTNTLNKHMTTLIRSQHLASSYLNTLATLTRNNLSYQEHLLQLTESSSASLSSLKDIKEVMTGLSDKLDELIQRMNDFLDIANMKSELEKAG